MCIGDCCQMKHCRCIALRSDCSNGQSTAPMITITLSLINFLCAGDILGLTYKEQCGGLNPYPAVTYYILRKLLSVSFPRKPTVYHTLSKPANLSPIQHAIHYHSYIHFPCHPLACLRRAPPRLTGRVCASSTEAGRTLNLESWVDAGRHLVRSMLNHSERKV